MSETEPIVPTSSVTALRIPIIKKGEYDLWSMKMRQYIAITDHILWDIITNGNQTTTDPASPSVSAPKTSLAANARRNNEKALNILLSCIRRTLIDIFAFFMMPGKKPEFSITKGFQHILSMLELHDATVSIEDANLKLKGVEHELKGVVKFKFSNKQCLSVHRSQGSTLKQSTAEPTNIPKGYTQAASSKGFGIESNSIMEIEHFIWGRNFDDSVYENFKREKAYKAVPSRHRYPHQRRSFTPSAVLTRDGLISTARPTMTQTVPSKNTANVTYQGTARSRVPQAVLSRSTDGPYYPRPQYPKKTAESIWVKKGSTVGSQAVLPQTISVKKSAMITSKQTWRQKGNYLDSVNRDNGSYTLKQFEQFQRRSQGPYGNDLIEDRISGKRNNQDNHA
ncbi:hypothetical protein Tco_0045430 [Tanacetum coccineum]